MALFDEYFVEIFTVLIIGAIIYLFMNWYCKCNANEKMVCSYGYSDSDGKVDGRRISHEIYYNC